VGFAKAIYVRGNNDLSALHGKWENWLGFETESLTTYI
jgi:hypothetical protein